MDEKGILRQESQQVEWDQEWRRAEKEEDWMRSWHSRFQRK